MSSVYSKLYDVVAANMEAAGRSFEYGKNTFLCDIESHPQRICVSRYLDLDNYEFMEAVYTAALKRLPDERTADFWRKKCDMPKEEFQQQVLHCIANSSVVAINQIQLIDNPYFEQNTGIRYHLLGRLYGLTDKSSLRELGKKMPMPIQKVIRKVFL